MNTAIDDLSLSLFKNQIFVLLGHNGAGKTTTIQALTGFINPTSGNAKAFKYDMFKQRDQLNEIIGICP